MFLIVQITLSTHHFRNLNEMEPVHVESSCNHYKGLYCNNRCKFNSDKWMTLNTGICNKMKNTTEQWLLPGRSSVRRWLLYSVFTWYFLSASSNVDVLIFTAGHCTQVCLQYGKPSLKYREARRQISERKYYISKSVRYADVRCAPSQRKVSRGCF